jgi:hypothetical protein
MMKSIPMSNPLSKGIHFLLIMLITSECLGTQGDFVIDNVFETALEIPRILYLMKRDPNGPALELVNGSNSDLDGLDGWEDLFDDLFGGGWDNWFDWGDLLDIDGLTQDQYEINWGYLDTGASGLLLSKETASYFGVAIDPGAQYVDVGVGGMEYFDISEPLYLGTLDYHDPYPEDQTRYRVDGPWRFQVKKELNTEVLTEPFDLIGTPAMMGATVVMYSRGPSNLAGFTGDIDNWTGDIRYFEARITDSNDPTIPVSDMVIPLRFEKFIMPHDPLQVPPLPTLAYNPVIDNITAEYQGKTSTGTWLFDTGAQLSVISYDQAKTLGLVDANGTYLTEPGFYAALGGVGEEGIVELPGFQIDRLIVPTLNGYNLVWKNAQLVVHDIGIIDEDTGEFILLDGVYGSNFLCATLEMATLDIIDTPFDYIIVDTRKGLLGLDVNDLLPLPRCGDADHPLVPGDITGDCHVDGSDLAMLCSEWLSEGCDSQNDSCGGTDLDGNGQTAFGDLAQLGADWGYNAFASSCGDIRHPWPPGDLNRDCHVDLQDLDILIDEWLNTCTWLNWQCRGADLTGDGMVDFLDYTDLCLRLEP